MVHKQLLIIHLVSTGSVMLMSNIRCVFAHAFDVVWLNISICSYMLFPFWCVDFICDQNHWEVNSMGHTGFPLNVWSMYLCMYVRTHVCVHVLNVRTFAMSVAINVDIRMYVCLHEYILVCMYERTHACRELHTYVRMYVWICECMYFCMYVCIYIYICMYACMYVCTHACMHARTHTHLYACMYVWIYVCVCWVHNDIARVFYVHNYEKGFSGIKNEYCSDKCPKTLKDNTSRYESYRMICARFVDLMG